MSEWHDIGSAPRDGTVILLYTPMGVIGGFWGDIYSDWCQDVIDSNNFGGTSFIEQPTHWMNLPEPPAQ